LRRIFDVWLSACPRWWKARTSGKRISERGGKIFATLSRQSEGYGVLLLTPEQQAGMIEDEPSVFSPVPGGWGRKGSTQVLLAKIPLDILEGALRTAWRRKAPKRLLNKETQL